MEHPYHNSVPITDYTKLQNDLTLLELTDQIDMTASYARFVNSACLPSMAPELGEGIPDLVSNQTHVGKTTINNFFYNYFRP